MEWLFRPCVVLQNTHTTIHSYLITHRHVGDPPVHHMYQLAGTYIDNALANLLGPAIQLFR